jgi:transcriptional regulator with XRE-family HTH domain
MISPPSGRRKIGILSNTRKSFTMCANRRDAVPRAARRYPEFAALLNQLMTSRGLSQAQLARDLDQYDGTVMRWRQGQGIELVNVHLLADYFGVERDYLARLAGYGDSEPSSPTLENLDHERQVWHAIYDELIEKKVPRSMWQSYIDACMAMADVFRNAGSLNTPLPDALNTPTPEMREGPDIGPDEHLTQRSRFARIT